MKIVFKVTKNGSCLEMRYEKGGTCIHIVEIS